MNDSDLSGILTSDKAANACAGTVPTYHATESVAEAKELIESMPSAKEHLNDLLDALRHMGIEASWDGLRGFWFIELTEEGMRRRDETERVRDLAKRMAWWLSEATEFGGGNAGWGPVIEEILQEASSLGVGINQ